MRKMIQILRTMTMMMMKMKIKKDIYAYHIIFSKTYDIIHHVCVCTVSSFLHRKTDKSKKTNIFKRDVYTFVYYIKINYIAFFFLYERVPLSSTRTSTRHSHFDHPILIFYNFFFFHFRLARTSLCFFFNNYFSNLFLDKRDYLHHFHLAT